MKNIYIFLLSVLFGLLFSQNIEAQNWTEITKLCASERNAGANLGFSVDIHGDYAIVGAPYSPSMFESLQLMSKEEILRRLEN